MISIVIVNKDRQSYLTRQIDYFNSHSGELGVEFEVVIYDDGSEVPLEVEGANFQYEFSRSSENVGLIQARNNAMKLVSEKAKYIFFLDDDIFVHNMNLYLRDAITAIDEGFSCVSLPFINLPTYKYERISTFKNLFDLNKNDDDVVFFFGGTSVFSKKDILDAGCLEGNYFIYMEEEDLALRLFSQGKKLKILYSGSYIGIHDQAPGKNWSERNMYLLSNRFIFHYKFVKNFPLRFLLNCPYVIAYLFKTKSISTIVNSFLRYKKVKLQVKKVELRTSVFLRFLLKRFFNR